jgi:hypothetical protein
MIYVTERCLLLKLIRDQSDRALGKTIHSGPQPPPPGFPSRRLRVSTDDSPASANRRRQPMACLGSSTLEELCDAGPQVSSL